MSKHIAVVLFNLGGPDSPEAIKPFLKNFFMDPKVIGAPKIIRWMLSRYIAWKRGRKNGPAGKSYERLGGASPLLENTRAQASALSMRLNGRPDYKFSVHVCMRYWHPMAMEVAAKVKDEAPDHIVLLPLYPQFSDATSGSSFEDWRLAQRAVDIDVPTSFVCCYPTQGGVVQAAADLIKGRYEDMCDMAAQEGLRTPRILFSAHGLPEDLIRDGDPYQWQCEKTAEAIVNALDIEGLDWQICYQSRVGPKKWIGPSTEQALKECAKDEVPALVFTHAFVSEHVETLVEIDEEYRELAAEIGVPAFERVPTLSVHHAFIDGLANIVESRIGVPGVASHAGGRLCPAGFCKCAMAAAHNIEGAHIVEQDIPDAAL